MLLQLLSTFDGPGKADVVGCDGATLSTDLTPTKAADLSQRSNDVSHSSDKQFALDGSALGVVESETNADDYRYAEVYMDDFMLIKSNTTGVSASEILAGGFLCVNRSNATLDPLLDDPDNEHSSANSNCPVGSAEATTDTMISDENSAANMETQHFVYRLPKVRMIGRPLELASIDVEQNYAVDVNPTAVPIFPLVNDTLIVSNINDSLAVEILNTRPSDTDRSVFSDSSRNDISRENEDERVENPTDSCMPANGGSENRAALTAKSTVVCFICRKTKTEANFLMHLSPLPPCTCCLYTARKVHLRGHQSRKCRQCAKVVVSFLFSIRQWIREDGKSLCRKCERSSDRDGKRECITCFEAKSTGEFDKNNKNEQRCRTCMTAAREKHRQGTWSRECGKCNKILVSTAFDFDSWFWLPTYAECLQCLGKVPTAGGTTQIAVNVASTLSPTVQATRCTAELSLSEEDENNVDDLVSNSTGHVVCCMCNKSRSESDFQMHLLPLPPCNGCLQTARKIHISGKKSRNCAKCSIRLVSTSFSLLQWLRKDTRSRCRKCERDSDQNGRRECIMCYEEKAPGDFSMGIKGEPRCRKCIAEARELYESGTKSRKCNKCMEYLVSTSFDFHSWFLLPTYAECTRCLDAQHRQNVNDF